MELPTFDKMRVHLADGVATLTFNDEALGNALSPALLSDYLSAITWASACEDVKVIVQTGAGKFFTTGRQLSPPSTATSDADNDKFIAIFEAIVGALIKCPKVLIASVNGPGAGYGLTCLALHDLVYSTPEAYFFAPFMKYGFSAEACSSITFPNIMGRQRAAAILLGGDQVTAQDLKNSGLINNIFPKDDLRTEVSQIARRIAGYPQTALEITKGLMRRSDHDELIEANARECRELRKRIDDPESMKLVAAYLEQKARKKSSRL